MATYLKDIHRRLDRARKHMQNFNRQATRFINSGPYEMITEIDDSGVDNILRYKLKVRKEMPPNLSFIVGDCIHNLRSLLDNIVWQLGCLSGCSKNKLNNLSFLVCKANTTFDVKKKAYSCLPQPAIDLITRLQPYQLYKGRNDPDSHPLWILNRLWNDDKHRIPILVVNFHTGTGISPAAGSVKTVQSPDGRLLKVFEYRPPKPMQIHAGGICEDGKDIATIPFRVGEPIPQFNVKVAFDIAFDESTPAKGEPTSKCLRNLYDS